MAHMNEKVNLGKALDIGQLSNRTSYILKP